MYFVFWLLFSLTFAGGDEGVGLDPNGGRVTVEEGCHIDPNGGCVGGLAGARIDDNG